MADSTSISAMSGSSTMRISGLASGLDTDTLVKQLMQAERIPLDKLSQNKQVLEWKRDIYREQTNLLVSFKNDFFDFLKPDNNMISSKTYLKYAATSSNTAMVTATANEIALPGTHTIKVTQYAEAAKKSTSAGVAVSKPVTGTGASAVDFTSGNNKFNLTLDGVTKTISLRTSSAYVDAADLVGNGTDGLQKLINDAFGAGRITVAQTGGTLTFNSDNSKIVLSSASTNDALGGLNITSGSSNRLNTSDKLQDLKLNLPLTFDASNKLTFTINSVNFSIDKTSTLNDLMNQINNSAAGVTMTYSEASDKFTLAAKTKGAGSVVIANTGGNLFDAVDTNSAIGVTTGSFSGKDAIFTLDNVEMKRNDNLFTVDGITYNLNENGPTGTTGTITVTQDADGIFNNIKAFVDRYNEFISKVNAKLDEKRYREYNPLTDVQKSEMKEAEITKWEEKAKSGLIKEDPMLRSMLTTMRRAISDAVGGAVGSLSEIGITTGSYTEKGKLIINENTLKDAIKTNPDKVKNLFAKTSSIDYSPDLTSAQRTQRYKEEGIAYRLYDIIQDNIRTTRDATGKKGFLIEKAGLVGDASQYINTMDTEINKKNIDINNLMLKLNDKQDNYYKKFTALEKALSRMSAQSGWLASQFGGQN